jgi:hypothetical protein
MSARSNHACATCPIVATVHDVSVPITNVGASNNCACATCSTVAMGEAHPLLLGHNNSDGTAVAGHLPIATEGCRSLQQRHIVVV